MEGQLDFGQTSSTGSSFATYPSESFDKGNAPPNRSYPVILHVAVVTAFVLPIAFLPYLAARRRIAALRREVSLLEKGVRRLKDDVDIAMAHQASTSSDLRSLKTSVLNALKESKDLRKQFNRQEVDRVALDEAMRKNLRNLLDESQHSRTDAATLRALGMSLADVAAFMHQVELDFGLETGRGKDQRGIERIRLLALQMQNASQAQENK